MKRVFLGTLLLALVFLLPIPTTARADVNVGISLPPIVFPAPPALIVLPGTYIYVVPDYDEDIFFYGGWWWRSWEGRWYRSHNYNRGWRYYRNVPSFYFDVDPGWRGYYKERNWYGHRWDYERIPERRLQQNWKSWNNSRHWERQRTWGVQNYQPPPQQQRQQLRQQRKQQYQQRPEVQQQRQPQKRSQQPSQVVQPQRPQPQSQPVKPQGREALKPKQSQPQTREVRQQRAQPQSQTGKQQVRKAAKTQKTKPQQGKSEREQEEKQDRK